MKSKADGRFKTYMEGKTEVEDTLPCTHITDAYSFADIQDFDSLRPMPCEVFGRDLTYLFYGRPAFRTKKISSANIRYDWPIVFVFSTDDLPDIEKIYPFDTGAFKFGMYEEYFHKKSKIEHFELEASVESIRRYVRTFYVTNKDYYSGQSRANFDPQINQFEVDGLREMARQPGQKIGSLTRDERSATIELQVAADIEFRSSLLAIVIPELYLNDEHTIEALSNWEVGLIGTYDTIHNINPDAWVGLIYSEVRRIYSELGYL